MNDLDAFEAKLRANENIMARHAFICDTLKQKDIIFSELIDFALTKDTLFVPHSQDFPGLRWWGVPVVISKDEIGRLKIARVFRIILAPYDDIRETERTRKELFLKLFELSHEIGHIAVFEEEDLTAWLDCSFVRLISQRICPYLELRACEEGIKILENIMEKYDSDIKAKKKLRKFFRKIYLSGEYRKTFRGECAIDFAENQLALDKESNFCPMIGCLKETLLKLNTLDSS